jgi:SAM-dependent methyltransferase
VGFEEPEVNLVFERIRSHQPVHDVEFDRIFPLEFQSLSPTFFTPTEIAVRAAELLVTDADTKVLDVGSGVGKFCLIGALSTRGWFYGVEQRKRLVDLAKSIADDFEIPRVDFLEGDARRLDWRCFQSFYLFNPFVEHLYKEGDRLDQSIGFSEDAYLEMVRGVQIRLHRLPVGTRVVTYHGFGGDMPPGYVLRVEEAGYGDYLRLWIKEREA